MRFVEPPIRIYCLAAGLVIALVAVFSQGAFAQEKFGPTDSSMIARGSIVYKDRCAICHFDESQAKKIGPGLSGIYKRGKFAEQNTN